MASDRLARGVLPNASTHRRWRIRTAGFFAYCRCPEDCGPSAAGYEVCRGVLGQRRPRPGNVPVTRQAGRMTLDGASSAPNSEFLASPPIIDFRAGAIAADRSSLAVVI